MVKRSSRPDPMLWAKLRPQAEQMRHVPTPAEDRLWQLLRGRQLDGYKFRRQRPIDRFIVDFACPQSGLIIEVDGEIHQQQVDLDRERDQILASYGYRILRFTNEEVLNHTEWVLNQIHQALNDNRDSPET